MPERTPNPSSLLSRISSPADVKSLPADALPRLASDVRAELNIFEERNGIIKFNPMIDVTREERDAYIKEHDLPFHPLVAQGYSSIGCSHCTVPGEGRKGRWAGKPKTECGLHL